MPDPLRTPEYMSVDPSDPMGPGNVRNLTLGAESAIRLMEEVRRVASHPGSEPSYIHARDSVVACLAEVADAIVLAQAEADALADAADFTAKLDMTRHENIRANTSARYDHAASLLALAKLVRLRNRLAACLGP